MITVFYLSGLYQHSAFSADSFRLPPQPTPLRPLPTTQKKITQYYYLILTLIHCFSRSSIWTNALHYFSSRRSILKYVHRH